MIKRNSSIPDILEFLNLPIDTVIISNKGSNKYKKYNGTCVYLKYSLPNQTKLSNVLVEEYNNDDAKPHNKNGPAEIGFYDDCIEVLYYINGEVHRINKPAIIYYNCDGLIIEEWYYIKGKCHNSVGPASRSYFNKKWENFFFIDGVLLSHDDFFERMERINDQKEQ